MRAQQRLGDALCVPPVRAMGSVLVCEGHVAGAPGELFCQRALVDPGQSRPHCNPLDIGGCGDPAALGDQGQARFDKSVLQFRRDLVFVKPGEAVSPQRPMALSWLP